MPPQPEFPTEPADYEDPNSPRNSDPGSPLEFPAQISKSPSQNSQGPSKSNRNLDKQIVVGCGAKDHVFKEVFVFK